MPRGQRELASLAMDGGRGVTSSRSRRALGDVSNKESDNNASKKRSENPSVRRSSRLSHEPEDQAVLREPNPADDTTEKLAAPVARRQSLRSSKASQSIKAAVNPFSEPKPRATRKRSQKSLEHTKSTQEFPDEVKPASNLQNSKGSRTGLEPQTKRARSNSAYKGQNSTDDSSYSTANVPLVGTKHCEDILKTNDHRLVRKPFTARQYVPGIGVHDLVHSDNPLHVPSYATDIFQRLYHAEDLTRPHPYMERLQPELNGSMRGILVDWLVEVHMKFRLLPETLYLCVNIIDRYLALEKVNRNRLQLVGVTALLIACKYEEIYPPEVRDCVYITDRAYTRQEVLDMEAAIVKTLKFTLTVPTGYPFLQRFLHITKATSTVRHLSSYYMERMLQEHSALMFKPSLLAAAAICLATKHPDRRDHDDDFDEDEITSPIFPPSLFEYSGFTENETIEAASLIAQKVGETDPQNRRRKLVAVKHKYASAGYGEVASNFSPPKVTHLYRSLSSS